MNKKISKIFVSTIAATLLVGCGGNSDSSSSKFSGKIIDGYIEKSTVCLDLDLDGFCGKNEPSDITDEKGSYSFSISSKIKKHTNFKISPLIALGGIDKDTGENFEGKLEALPNKKGGNLTPLTTVVAKMAKNEITTKLSKENIRKKVEEKKKILRKVLDLPNDTNIDEDFIDAKNKDLNKAALQIQKTIELVSKALDDGSKPIEQIQEKVIEIVAKKTSELKSRKKLGAETLVNEVTKEAKKKGSDIYNFTGKVLTSQASDTIKTLSKNIDTAFDKIEEKKAKNESFKDIVEKVALVTESEIKKVEKNIAKSDYENNLEEFNGDEEIFSKPVDSFKIDGILKRLEEIGLEDNDIPSSLQGVKTLEELASDLFKIDSVKIAYKNFFEVFNSDFLDSNKKYLFIKKSIDSYLIENIKFKLEKVYEDKSFKIDLNNYFKDFKNITFELVSSLNNLILEKGVLKGVLDNSFIGENKLDIKITNSSNIIYTKTLFIEVLNVNDAPTLKTKIKDVEIKEKSSNLSLDVKKYFEDTDLNDKLTYSATLDDGKVLPSWLKFENGIFKGTPNNKNVGKISIKITAKDKSNLTVSDTFNLTVKNVNDAPLLKKSISNATVEQNKLFKLDIKSNFEDIDVGDKLTYIATLKDGNALPSWLSFKDGVFSGTPSSIDVTTNPLIILVNVKDNSNLEVSDTFTLDVMDKNDSPIVKIDNFNDVKIIEDKTSIIDLNKYFNDIDINDKLTYSATLEDGSVLPSWITLTKNNLNINGKNENVGDITVKITATDKLGLKVSNLFTLTVLNTNDAPTTKGLNLTVNIGNTLNGKLVGNDVDKTDSISYIKVKSPSNGTLNIDKNGNFKYTPNKNFVGKDKFTFKVNDGTLDSNTSTVIINVIDGKPLNSKVEEAIDKLKSIDPEIENIDKKLNEAKDILIGNNSAEAKIVSLSISLAEILNDETISSVLDIDNKDSIDLTDTTMLNKIVSSMARDLVTLDIIDNPSELSAKATDKLNDMADELIKISNEFGNLFTNSDDVYNYDGEKMNYNDSLALRAGILSAVAQLKFTSSYQWGSDEDFKTQSEEIDGTTYEYMNININPASVMQRGTFFKLNSQASVRLASAKQNFINAVTLLENLPIGYKFNEEKESLTQENKDDIEKISQALSGQDYILEIEKDDEIKSATISLSKIFDISTALDIKSLGTSWQNLCNHGDIISIEEAKKNNYLECRDTYGYYGDSDFEPQVMPTSKNSKIDDIVLSITKLDGSILTGQDMFDYMFKDQNKIEALGTTWTNVKKDEKFLVNGNDVDVNYYTNTLKVNAYKSKGINSRAEARKNFTTPKSFISANMVLEESVPARSHEKGDVSRGSMIANLINVNSSGDNIFAKLELRDGKIKYYVAKYDANWTSESEKEIGSGTIATTQTVYDLYGQEKINVSIETTNGTIKFSARKVINDSVEELETYVDKVVTVDNTYDLNIDQVKFRAEVRLDSDDGSLYEEVNTPTKLRVQNFSATNALETLSFSKLTSGEFLSVPNKSVGLGEGWYDSLSYDSNTNILKGIEYADFGAGLYNKENTFSFSLTPTSKYTAKYVENGEEGILKLLNTSSISGYDNVYKTIVSIEVTKANKTLNWKDWNWENPTYNDGSKDVPVVNISSLISLFIGTSNYIDNDKNGKITLNDKNEVVKAITENFAYKASDEVVGSWIEDTENNRVILSLEKEKIYLKVVEKNGNYSISQADLNDVGFIETQVFISGSGLDNYKTNELPLNPKK